MRERKRGSPLIEFQKKCFVVGVSILKADCCIFCYLTPMAFVSYRCEMLATLTPDLGKILTSMHDIKMGGRINLLDGLQIAQVVKSIHLNQCETLR